MPPSDEFDTIITDGFPAQAAGPRARTHPVLWFAVGALLWQANGILLYLFLWLLRHG